MKNYRNCWLYALLLASLANASGCSSCSPPFVHESEGMESTEEDDGPLYLPGVLAERPESYDAVMELTEDASISGEKIISSRRDENAVRVMDGARVNIENSTIERSSDVSTGGDEDGTLAERFGIGSAVLDIGGTTTLTGCEIKTDAQGGAGAFAGKDGDLYLKDTKVTTSGAVSGGINAAGSGAVSAWNVDVSAEGARSPVLRCGEESVIVIEGIRGTSRGPESPAIAAGGEVSVNGGSLSSENADAALLSGRSAVRLYGTELSGSTVSLTGGEDGGESDCLFLMDGGSLQVRTGGTFYTSGTESSFILKSAGIRPAADSPFLLRLESTPESMKTGEGTTCCNFTAISQELSGDIIRDSFTTLDLYLSEGSSYTGAIRLEDPKGLDTEDADGYCSVIIGPGSRWVVTGDSRVSDLCCEGEIRDAKGLTVTIMDTEGEILEEGEGEFTIIAESFDGSADLSGGDELPPFHYYRTYWPE